MRLISHRSFGFYSAAPLIALTYPCCRGLANRAAVGIHRSDPTGHSGSPSSQPHGVRCVSTYRRSTKEPGRGPGEGSQMPQERMAMGSRDESYSQDGRLLLSASTQLAIAAA